MKFILRMFWDGVVILGKIKKLSSEENIWVNVVEEEECEEQERGGRIMCVTTWKKGLTTRPTEEIAYDTNGFCAGCVRSCVAGDKPQPRPS